jgi:hypothetical protein
MQGTHRHTHEHEQGNQYRTTRKPLPRTTTTGQAKTGWLVSNPLRADIGTTADTAKSASTFQKAALTIRFTTLSTKSGDATLSVTDHAAC